MKPARVILPALVIVACVAVTAIALQSVVAHAQTSTSSVAITTSQTSVYEGGLAVFQLVRTSGYDSEITVQVKTWEPDHIDAFGANETDQVHDVTFPVGVRIATLSLSAYVDTWFDVGELTLKAQVQASTNGDYTVGDPDIASISVIDIHQPPQGLSSISLAASSSTATEGDTVTFTLTRSGTTTNPLTVNLDVEDPQDFLRGNHWDEPPDIPTGVEFPGGSGTQTQTVVLDIPDDQRDRTDGKIKFRVLPSHDYLLAPGVNDSGLELLKSVDVTDDDTAQELELNFGKDGVDGVNGAEGDTFKIVVKRRQQDTGQTATFTVRVEVERSGADHVLEEWEQVEGRSRRYRDFPLEITGSDTQVEQVIEIVENGVAEALMIYTADIRTLEDHEGNELDAAEEAEYWTVKTDFRGTAISPTDNGAKTGTITLTTDQTTAVEGQEVIFTLTREGGPVGRSTTATVETSEERRETTTDGVTTNPSLQEHEIAFEPWQTTATLRVYPYVDMTTETGADPLDAEITSVVTGYTIGSPSTATVEIGDAPSSATTLSLQWGSGTTADPDDANATTIDEGGSVSFSVTRTGSTTQDLTVGIEVDDPEEVLRGNHWDLAPDIPSEIIIPAGDASATFTLNAPDDQRDVTDGTIGVRLLASEDYYLGAPGLNSPLTVNVTDNDTFQVLRFKWGFLDSYAESSWEPGESWLDETDDGSTPGPAEGLYYYEDNRSFLFDHELDEHWPAHFRVIRRGTDIGKTVTFTVRVEHNRGWVSARHTDWSVDPVTGNHYKDFELTLTGDQRQVVGRVALGDNGRLDHDDWQHSARILRITDADTGEELTDEQEAQYWRVNSQGNNYREHSIHPNERGWPEYNFLEAAPDPVAEGGEVTFTLQRQRGDNFEPLEIQVRTWEPNLTNPDGTNPSDQLHTVTFPAEEVTSLHQRAAEQTQTITVTTTQDTIYETSDVIKAEIPANIVRYDRSEDTIQVSITDDDQPTITLSADRTTATEGDTVTFTLTRGNNTTQDLIVGVQVDDPGGFLQGNSASQAVEVPSSVSFAPGDATKEITITPPDDWRDIPDSTLTFTVAQEPEYEIIGSDTLTVQLSDNDVAPQVGISFVQTPVSEAEELVLVATRTGETKNPLEIPITAGPVGDQQYMVLVMDAGSSEIRITVNELDNDVKGPDVEYKATLHPEAPEFWTTTGATTVTGTVLDDDVYLVGVEALETVVDEGQLLPFRYFHNGHTGERVTINLERSQTGSAVREALVNETGVFYNIPAGSSDWEIAYIAQRQDGSDGDAVFTVELLPGDGYEIDPDHASASITVRDTDPLPVISFPGLGDYVDEGDGTAEIDVDLASSVLVIRTVTVDYEVTGATAEDIDLTNATGTLEFPPGTTQLVIEVPIVQDNLAEGNEQFNIVLSNPTGANLQDERTTLSYRVIIQDDEAEVSVEAAGADSDNELAVNEGTDIVLTLTRTGDTTEALDAWLQVVDRREPVSITYPKVTFSAGSDTAEYTIETVDDQDDLGNYEITVTVAEPGRVGEPRTYHKDYTATIVTVRDTDLPKVRVYPVSSEDEGEGGLYGTAYNYIPLPPNNTEGDNLYFLFQRNHGGRELTVDLEWEGAAGFASGTLPATAVLARGVRELTLTIPTEDDAVAEDNGDITVTVKDGTGYIAGNPDTASHWIYDNDGDLPRVRVTAVRPWVNEGEDVVFTITRSGDTTGTLDVNLLFFHTRDSGDHQTTEEDTVTIAAGSDSATITRTTTDDQINYGNASIVAALMPGEYYRDQTTVEQALQDTGQNVYNHVRVWVQDDDRPTVTLGPATTEYEEGDHMEVTIGRTGDTTVLLYVDTSAEITRKYPAPLQDQTESSRNPFTQVSAGESSSTRRFAYTGGVGALGATGRIWLVPDSCPDDDEDCGLVTKPHICIDDPGQNRSNCAYAPQYHRDNTQYQQDFVIHNDFMGVRIEADQSTVDEGTAATFTLYRHGGAPGSLAKTLEVEVQVTQEGDYISGTPPTTVTFAANTATATLTVATDDDAVDEANGTITATLLRPSTCNNELNCYAIGEYPGTVWEVTEVTTAVTDDDYLLPTVSIADALGKEPDGTIEFTVSLDAPNTQEIVSVDWATAADGNATTDTAATSGTDYTAASGTLTFAIGEAEKTISVALLDDHKDEYHETFSVTLSNPQKATLGDATATGTIRDDEQDFAVIFYRWTQSAVEGEELGYTIRRLPPLTPGETLSSGDACFDEPDDLACFNESLDADTGNIPLTINIKVTESGDMISGTTPTTVTFEPDAIFYDLVIPTQNDAVLEPTSVVTIQVLDGAGYSAGYTHVGIVSVDDVPTVLTTVYDNDLTISVGDVSASESAGTLDFTVELNAPAPEEISIDVATEDGDATSYPFVTASSLGQDYTARSETVTFLAGEQTKTFSVSVEDDTIQERNETFSVVLSNPPPHTTLLKDTATGTIIDDEASLVARVYRAYGLANENQAGPVRFMVELSHTDTTTHERNPAVAWETTAGTATEGEDYHAAGGKLTFPVGTTMGFVDVQLIDDNLVEAELETLSVNLDGQDTRLVSISPTEGSYEVNIRDDESLTAFITAVTENVAEGQDAVFAVTLSGGVPSEDVSVNFETGGTADEMEDYGTPFGDITFPAGDTTGRSGSLTIPAGETTGTITYPILTDSLEEYDETLEVVLFSATSAVRIGTIDQYAAMATANIHDEDTLIVGVEGTPSVAEGGTATFTITLSTASDDTVSVGWATDEPGEAVADDQRAEPNEDFNADDGTLAIPAGSTSATLTIPTTDDTLVEKTEYFRVLLQEATKGTGVPPEMVPLGATYATGTITDDDAAPDGLSVSADTTNIAESAGAWPLRVTVTLDGTTQFTHDIPVTLEFVNRPNVAKNAEPGVDYTAPRVETVIRAGRSSVTKTVTFDPLEDNIAEGDEIARLTAKSTALSNDDAMGITIEDNDPEPVEVVLAVTPDTLTESSGATNLTVTATLSGLSLREVDTVVTLMATGVTATAGQDFQAAAGSLTIPAGKLSARGALTLTVLEDTTDEDDETLEITGTVPGAIDVVADEVTIQDNDAPPTGIGLSVTASLMTEGGSAVDIPVEATLLGGGTRAQDTEVDLVLTDLTATVGDDYTASWSSQTITIPAGEFSASITLTINPVDDTFYEGLEHMSVRATNTDPGLPVNGVRLTIEDDDPQPTTIALSLSKEEVPETAGVALLDVTATLEGDSTLTTDTEIFSQVDSTRNAARTYFGYFLDDLKIDAGESTGKVTLVIIDINDHVDDDDETVTVRGMASDPNLMVTEATLTIKDDDTYGVTISPTSLSVTEGLRTSYTVRLDSEPTSAVTVFIDLPPNAGFTVSPGHLNFTPQRWGNRTVTVRGKQDADADDEPAATITHSITTSDSLYKNAATDDVTVTVRDDDDPAVTVSFGAATYTVAESDDASTTGVTENEVEVTVELDVDPERTVAIPLTQTPQGGITDADYSGVPATVTFNSGETEKTFTFTATGDTEDDDGESVKLTFGTLPTDVSEGTTNETVISITDDDVTAVTVSFGQGSYTVDESDDAGTLDVTENEVAVKVVLSADPKRTVTIPLTETKQGGASASDYSGVPANVVFNSGDTEKSFTFTATSDVIDDDDESVKLTFGTLPTGVSEGTTKETVISITDDDVPQVTVSFGAGTYTVGEGGTVSVKVKLNKDPERTVALPLSITHFEGASGADYSGVPGTVTFQGGDTEKSFSFAATQDTVDDDGEYVLIGFVTLPPRVTSATPSQTTVSITDDDTAGVNISETELEVPEGGDGSYTVKLDSQPTGDVSVTIGGFSGTDLTLDETSLTFTKDDWGSAQTVTVSAGEDADALDDSEVITHTVASDDDALYDDLATPSLDVTVLDNETVTKTTTLTMAAPVHTDVDSSGEVDLGDTLAYTAVATNSGNVPLENVNVKDLLTDTSGTDCATLAIGAECKLTGVYTITQADVDAGEVKNTATASADGASPKGYTRTTDVNQIRKLTLEKTSTESGFGAKDDELSYSYKATNSGTVTLKGTLSVTDDKVDADDITCPTVPDVGLAPGAALTCTADYTVTQDDVDEGEVKNTASATLGGTTSAEVSLTLPWRSAQGSQPTLSIGSATDLEDAGTIGVTVRLSAASLQTVTVDYATSDGTATAGADYTAASGTVTFSPGDLTETVSVAVTDDDIDEDTETLKVTLSDPVNATVPAGAEVGTISITDDDTAGVTVTPTSLDITEGGNKTYTVVLDSEPAGDVAVTPGGITDTDLTLSKDTLTFTDSNWDTAQSVKVTVAHDDGSDDESATITHTVASDDDADYEGISASSVAVAITDDEVPQVKVSFEQSSYTVAEGSSVTIKVKLSGDPERTVAIPLSKDNQGGATGSDYSGVPNNVTFNSGDTEKTFSFLAASDNVDDDGESVKLTFGAMPTRVTEGTTKETVVSITDDDVPQVTVSFESATYSVDESDDADTTDVSENQVVVKVKLSADPERTVTVPITKTHQGGATGADYSGVPASVAFNSGDTEKSFTFSAAHDTVDDDDEKVKLTFGTLPTRVSEGTTKETVISINDDDVPRVTASFGATGYTVDEGSTVAVKVKLNKDPERTVALPLSITHFEGASGADYSGVPGTVTFQAGDTEKSFSFAATQDTVDDDGEYVLIGFVTLPERVTSTAPSQTTVSITDDDDPAVTVSFGQTSHTVAESDDPDTDDATENEATIKVILSADPERTVTVPITRTNQGGATTADYSVPASVQFASGDTEKEITFAATHDTVDDDGEKVKLTFGTLPPGVAEGTTKETVISITDDDLPDVKVSFGAGSYSAQEGSSVEVSVTLDKAPERAVTIPITKTHQGGATNSDYSGIPTSVAFSATDTEKKFTFSAVDDSVDDDGESVKLTFGTLPSQVAAGTTAQSILNITDGDDPTVTVQFEETSYDVDEGSTVSIKVILSADPERQVVIPLTKTNQGGASNSDYSGVPTSLNFGSGDTEKSFTFSATDDTADDDGEEVKLNFGTMPAGVNPGTNSETIVSIGDDDVPATVTAEFGSATYSADEGGTVEVKVTLSIKPERSVTIPLTKTNQGGASSGDYSGVPTSLSFGAEDTSKTFTFTATQDTVDDDDESVKVVLGTLPTGISEGTVKETVIAINDDDVPTVTVSFEKTAYSVTEGDSENIKVILSAKPERAVTITVAATLLDGAGVPDFTGAPATLNFGKDDTEKTITFAAYDDAQDDDGEGVRLTFAPLPAQVNAGSNSPATVSIVDNDDPAVTVSFESATYTVAESDDPDTVDATENEVTVKVVLSADPERQVVIPLTTTLQGGATAADYSGVPTSVTFESGDTSVEFTFSATHDTVDDDGESVKLTFGALPTRVSSATPRNTTVSITDDDVPSVTVSFGNHTYSVAESDDPDTTDTAENELTIKVKLSADPERTVEVPITVTKLSGVSDDDFSLAPGKATFNSGDTETTITLTATGDSIDDNGERVMLTFGTLPHRVGTTSPSQAVISINDDDTAGVNISETELEVPEGGSSTYTVKLDSQPTGDVSVTIGGFSGTDLTLDETSLTFTKDDWGSAQTVTVSAGEDADALDDSEVITHTVASDDDALYDDLATPSLDVTVLDNETVTKTTTLTMAAPVHTDVDSSGEVDLGDTLAYTAVATNSGNVPLENVNVKDLLTDTSGTDCATLAIGAECKLTGVYTITQADVDAGEVKNTATASADGASPKGYTRTTDVNQIRKLTLEKTSTESGFGAKDDELSYSYKATNSGTVTLKGTLSVTDDKVDADDITCPTVPDVGLAPGAALTCTADYTVTQDDVDEGEVKNTASATLGGTTSAEVSLTLPWRSAQGSQPTLSIGSATDLEDAGTIGVTVRLSAASLQTVTVDYATSDGTATAGADYTAASGTVTFSPGDLTETVSVAVTDDDIDEDTETLKVTLSDPVNATVPAGAEVGTISITDDDTAGVTVTPTSLDITEGGNKTYTVVLDSEPAGDVAVTPGGITDTDLTLSKDTLTFTDSNWDTAQSVKVTVAHDDGSDDESATITHTVASDDDADYEGISASSVAVAITDDEVPQVKVSFEQSSYTVAEGSSVTIKVKLSGDPERTVAIPLSKDNQGGATGSDYSGVPNNVTFNSGDTEKTFSFLAASDNVDDDGESVKLTFGAMPTRVTEGTTKETVVSITDDDVPQVTVSFESATYSVDESDDADTTDVSENQVVVKVKLSADPERTVTVPITKTHQGGATGADYSGVPASVAFNSGDTEKSFTFSATHDTVDDDDEKVKLTFGTLPTRVSEGTTKEAVVSIGDDDVPRVTVSFGTTGYTVDEGSTVAVKVKLNKDPERTVAVPITITHFDGVSGADYSGVPGTVTFQAGDTEKSFSFAATDDTDNDDGEYILLGLGNLPARVSSAAPSQATVSITDDDVPQVTVSFGSATYSVAESDDPDTTDATENEATVKVTLSADPERTVTIPITKNNQGGATNADYSGVPASMVFNSGDTEKSFTLSATADTVDDDDERVKLTFGTLPTGVQEGSTKAAVVSIMDDDDPSVTVSFGSATYSVAESDDASTTDVTENEVTVKVKLSADPERTVTIPISKMDQDGASSADYSGVPTSVTFESGDTEKTFTFSATHDNVDDDNEKVKLTFGTLPTRVSEGTTKETVISIGDDDSGRQFSNKEISGGGDDGVAIGFEQGSYQVREGSTTVIKVTLSADPETDFSMPLTPTDGTGLSSSDYSGLPATVDFVSGETEKTFMLTAVQDQQDESDETLTIGFGPLLTGLRGGDNTQAIVTILDSVHVSFDASTYEAYEGGAGALVTVELDQAAPAETVIPIMATGMNGATADDWTGVPASLTFDAGNTEKSFTVMAYDDDVEDDGETVELTFGTLPAGVAAGTPGAATVELMNTEELTPPSCEDAVWCADVEFADKSDDDWGRMDLFYHPNQDPGPEWSSISDDRFDFGDDEYFIWHVSTYPGVHPDVLPRASASVPERSVFSITLGRWDSTQRFSGRPKKEHYQDWILWVGDEPFPLSETDGMNGMTFVWLDEAFFDLYAGWREGKTYRLMIEDSPLSERPAQAPTMPSAPRHLEVINTDHGLAALWHEPLDDGNSPVTHYLLQWKLRSESWSDQNAVSEVAVNPPSSIHSFPGHLISGLTNESIYDLRVIAVNAHGESPPSNEHFGMPQKNGLKAVRKTVNGDVVTLTYNHALDTTSVPDKGRFIVLANSGLRPIGSVDISGRNVNLTLESGVNAADRVTVRYIVPPVPDEEAIRDTTGRYAYTIDSRTGQLVVENLTDPAGVEDLTSEFVGIPSNHDGAGDELRFKIRFSEPVRIDSGPPHGYLLEVEGGRVTSAWWVERDTTLWQIVLVPEDDHDITVTLPAGRPCIDQNVRGGPCASGDRKLTTRLEHTITGDDGARGPRSLDPKGENLDEGADDTSKDGKSESVEEETGDEEKTPPSAPENLIARANDDGSVVLTWDDPDDDSVTGYQILRRRPSEGERSLLVHVQDTGNTDTSYTDADTTPGIRYIYRVKAINDVGSSERSNKAEATPPEPPSNSPATGAPSISGTVQAGETLWADTSGIADDDGLDNASFTYQWQRDGSNLSGATSSSYTLTDSDVDKRIRVQVSFTDDGGYEETLTSADTAVVQARPMDPEPEPLQKPPAPSNLVATVNEDGTITLTWDAPNDDSVTGYRIMRRRPHLGEDTLLVYVADTGNTATTLTDTDVTEGTRHTYRVKAINAAGVGRRSNYATADP